jgi:hypothetical protein
MKNLFRNFSLLENDIQTQETENKNTRRGTLIGIIIFFYFGCYYNIHIYF